MLMSYHKKCYALMYIDAQPELIFISFIVTWCHFIFNLKWNMKNVNFKEEEHVSVKGIILKIFFWDLTLLFGSNNWYFSVSIHYYTVIFLLLNCYQLKFSVSINVESRHSILLFPMNMENSKIGIFIDIQLVNTLMRFLIKRNRETHLKISK